MSQNPLPYGITDIDPVVSIEHGRVRCYIRGCERRLRPAKDFCPVHGIRCHSSSGETYSYGDVRRNIIVSPELLATRVVGHSFKYESNRLGFEKSEDALTWNVFRSLQEAGSLNQISKLVIGQDMIEEPLLFLWGLCMRDDTLVPWDLLIAARKRFENSLPVARPLTEPDIGLYLPGRYLILIEAKFTSPNSAYKDGPRKDDKSLTKAELLSIYSDPTLEILDADRASQTDKVYYQLWRNAVFAEWMALTAGGGTRAYLANLTRASAEVDSCAQFRQMLRSGFEDRFAHLSWEGIYRSLPKEEPRLKSLFRHLETKTASLLPAFQFEEGK